MPKNDNIGLTQVIDTIFDNFNIRSFSLSSLNSLFLAKKLQKQIANSKSLRFITLNEVDFTIRGLDGLEFDSYAKQWVLNIKDKNITKKYKRKLQKLILEKNDNSIFIEYSKNFYDLPQMSQMFQLIEEE